MPAAARTIEIHLECGDTISSSVEPRIGAYRKCIHCDSNKKVTAIASATGAQGALRAARLESETGQTAAGIPFDSQVIQTSTGRRGRAADTAKFNNATGVLWDDAPGAGLTIVLNSDLELTADRAELE